MSRSKKSSGSNSKNDTNSFQSLKSKILKDIEDDSSQSENFVSEPLDKEIQLVDDINNIINNKNRVDGTSSDNTSYNSSSNNNNNNSYDDNYIYDDDYSDDDYDDDDYDNDYDNSSDDYMDSYLSNNVTNDVVNDVTDDDVSASDQELLMAYVGKNYKKIVSMPFNVFGFLFTVLYVLYRKMYSYSLILLAILVAVFIFIKSPIIVLIIYLILAIFIGFTINKIYISSAKRRVNKIKQKNINMHYQEIRDICSLNGGTSIRGVISITLIVVVCSLAILFVIGGPNSSLRESIDKIFFNKDKNKDDGHTNEDYRGFISYDLDVVIKDEFSIVVPEVFVNGSSSYNYYYKYYADGDVFGSCRIKLGSVLNYSDPNLLISKMIGYYGTIYEIDSPISGNKVTINNVDWTWFFYKSTNVVKYFYATIKNKKVYLFSYEIDSDSTSNECENYRENILKSIESK